MERLLPAAVTDTAPGLLDLFGVGHDRAAVLLIVAGDNPERLTAEAAASTVAATDRPTPLCSASH
ncbi:hypothetical protein [Micromonospora sp. NPDC001898]|uniref:hypothetical protein n=1 Tax=Micromonospora sp. NPDC001898 TaxID=3364221 RepID=UPI0036C58F9A